MGFPEDEEESPENPAADEDNVQKIKKTFSSTHRTCSFFEVSRRGPLLLDPLRRPHVGFPVDGRDRRGALDLELAPLGEMLREHGEAETQGRLVKIHARVPDRELHQQILVLYLLSIQRKEY